MFRNRIIDRQSEPDILKSGTRTVWVTNYLSDEDFQINVPLDDRCKLESSYSYPMQSKEIETSHIDRLPLSTSYLRQVMILLDRLQQRADSSMSDVDLAQVPRQLMHTLAQPMTDLHSKNFKPIQSPSDVVERLVESFHLADDIRLNVREHPCDSFHRQRVNGFGSSKSVYGYKESQEHKAKLISNLLRSRIK